MSYLYKGEQNYGLVMDLFTPNSIISNLIETEPFL